MSYKIKTLNNISPSGLSLLDRNYYDCSGEEENPQGILLRSADMHSMELPTSLMAIARAGAGVNNIPVEACTEKGIVVFNTPGANANAVKEMVMAGLLLSARKIVPAIEWVQSLKGSGAEVSKLVEKGKSKFAGPELMGKKLGVIGLGAIGRQVANMAVKFGMDVYGYDPYISVDSAWELSRSVVHAKSLEEIYRCCDFITLHVPLGSSTREMINASSIDTMKHGVRILNFARGELVSAPDLLEAIEEKRVMCYVTDFPTDEMLDCKGIIPIPHLGASTPESEDNCARMAVKQLTDYLENGNIHNSVNLPEVTMERMAAVRIGVINRNVPNMIAQISQVLSESGNNIANLTNKSRNEYAYTLIDLEGAAGQELLAKLQAIDGVIRASLFSGTRG